MEEITKSKADHFLLEKEFSEFIRKTCHMFLNVSSILTTCMDSLQSSISKIEFNIDGNFIARLVGCGFIYKLWCVVISLKIFFTFIFIVKNQFT